MSFTSPCPTCPRKYKAVGGDGPQPASILCIAERPGQDESRHGRVLCGKTGQEWDDLYLPLAGLERSEVRACNTVLCGSDNNKAPTDKEIAQCAQFHLPDEIKRTKPEVVILMGSSACSLVQGIRLDMMHGIPQHTSKVGRLFGWDGWLVPLYHPSMGLHESRWMKILMDDWNYLGRKLGHFSTRLVDHWEGDPPQETAKYELLHGELGGMHPRIAIDTETHGGQPWSIQWSGFPGTGYMLRADDLRGIGKFAAWVKEENTGMIFHNAAYDMEILRRMGIPVNLVEDTMQSSYHLGNLPQGLKSLTYRLFRHTMTSYEETVRPASIRALQDWMMEAYRIAQLDLSYTERVQLKTKVKEVVHKGELESLLTRLMRLTDSESEYDPWERLGGFWSPNNEFQTNHVEARIGRYPILGIGNCSMDQAVRYAVGDADWCGRVAVRLEQIRKESFIVNESDRDS